MEQLNIPKILGITREELETVKDKKSYITKLTKAYFEHENYPIFLLKCVKEELKKQLGIDIEWKIEKAKKPKPLYKYITKAMIEDSKFEV